MVRIGGRSWAIVVGGLLLVAAPANGQAEPERLPVGQSVTSSLTDSLERLWDSPFRAYRFEANEGSVYQVTVTDVDFEPEVRIARTVGGMTDYMVTTGDQGMGAGALLEILAPTTGDLLVVVQSEDGGTGDFTLTVREVAPGVVRPLEFGRAIPWAIGVEVAPIHSFTASAGEEIQITVRSREFDTFLEVGRMVGGELAVMESDDDGAGGTDSRVYFTPPTTGEYAARVRDYGGSATGSYAILLAVPPEIPEPRPLPFGERVAGRLTESDPLLDGGHAFNDWEIILNGGDRVAIELQSADFDTYLSVGRMEGRRFVELASNDDWGGAGPGDTDSKVLFSVPDDGVFIVRVRPFGVEQRGGYTLFTSAMAPLRAEPLGGDLTPGATVTGTITEDDAVLDDGNPYQEWHLTVSVAGRYDIQARSSSFDTFLILGQGRGGGFDEITTNDDWSGAANGTDSRIVAHLEPGDYTVRIRPFRDSGRGDYQVSVQETTPARTEPAGGPIQAGQTITAVLSDEDTRLIDDDVPYQEWVFRAEAGAGFVIQLSSRDFDSYLSLGYRLDGGFVELASNDDYGDSMDSRIDFVAPGAGEYLIRARPLFDANGGEYTLTLTSAP